MTKVSIKGKCLSAVVILVVLVFGGMNVAIAHEDDEKGAKGAQPALSAEGKRVVGTLNAYAAAVQAGDITQIESFVVTSEAFSSLEGAFLDQGWASARKHMADELPMFKDTRYHFSNIRPYVSGDLAYAILDYVMDITIAGEQFEGGEHKLSMKGKATLVLSKSNNEWKIRHIHTSREAAKAPATGDNPH